MMMKRIIHWMPLFLLAAFVLAGCEKKVLPEEEEEEQGPVQASALIQKINGFIKDAMSDVYLWYDKIPVIDIRYETDPKVYFDKILYSEDRWSYITDDLTAFEGSQQGIEKTYGYSLAFGRFIDALGNPTGNYFGIVEYVYPNTPASEAGFTRGDLIIRLNGGNITADNYRDLLSGTSASVTKGILTSEGISTGATVVLVAEELHLDPVLMYKIIENGGYKIGYLVYLQYIPSYNGTSLKVALQYFMDNQITDMVLDLRYNPGGFVSAAQYLTSSIAPQGVVDNASTLVTYQWNDKYQAYWISKDRQDQLGVNFDPTVPVKLGLSKLYVLTGHGTASASELTICGLEPYMEMTTVGDTTYGKYTASTTIKPEEWYTNEADYSGFENWGLQPIIIRYANAQGVTNFKNGFAPDFVVRDELLPAYPLGDLTEPLLKKAVEDITGLTLPVPKRAVLPVEYIIVDHGFSKFDEQKRNLFIDAPGNILNIPD
ncbi:MAG: S41 family peptidase [Bacteroidales bacterium]|nr:S41 family peptidase [Bacteroidales bacterium]